MDTKGKVVVLVKPNPLHNRELDVHAARIQQLGLTAYGKTADEALRKVGRMLYAAVQAHRECGDLESWLDKSGLEWHWQSEYDGPTPVQDAKTGQFLSKKGEQLPSPAWHDTDSEQGMAA